MRTRTTAAAILAAAALFAGAGAASADDGPDSSGYISSTQGLGALAGLGSAGQDPGFGGPMGSDTPEPSGAGAPLGG